MNTDQLNAFLHQAIPFVGRSELNILDAKPGYVRLTMPFALNKNHLGTMYAGAQFTLGEIAGGVLFLSTFNPQAYYPLAKELTITYQAPMDSSAFVEARFTPEDIERIQQELDTAGKSNFTLTMQLTNEKNLPIAEMKGLYQGRKK